MYKPEFWKETHKNVYMQKGLVKEINGITLTEKKVTKHIKGVSSFTGCVFKKNINISPGRSDMI